MPAGLLMHMKIFILFGLVIQMSCKDKINHPFIEPKHGVLIGLDSFSYCKIDCRNADSNKNFCNFLNKNFDGIDRLTGDLTINDMWLILKFNEHLIDTTQIEGMTYFRLLIAPPFSFPYCIIITPDKKLIKYAGGDRCQVDSIITYRQFGVNKTYIDSICANIISRSDVPIKRKNLSMDPTSSSLEFIYNNQYYHYNLTFYEDIEFIKKAIGEGSIHQELILDKARRGI